MKTETSVREREILDALRVVKDPDLHQDIVKLGFVKNLRAEGGDVSFDIELTTPACPVKEDLKRQAHEVVKALPGVDRVAVNMTAQVRKALEAPAESGIRDVRTVIAVASGKGGVGKSTVATNLAIRLARSGAKVGLMDADVYGPSVPLMLGGRDKVEPGRQSGWIKPLERHGVKFVSMGLFTGKDTPVIWRGPMATKLIQQFLGQVDWGDLDYLLIDLPPGTGDVQLTLTQSVPLTGAVIVTTPQDVAVGVTMRGLRMFEQVQVPILGIVENMSGFVCEHCGQSTQIFRQGGGRRAAEVLGVPFLGEIPLDRAIAEASDAGLPVAASDDLAPSVEAFSKVAGRLAQEISTVNEKTRSMKHRPESVEKDDHSVTIKWTDGHTSKYAFTDLRLACPCALCVDEWTGEARLDPAHVPEDVTAQEIKKVGRYALQFFWSDGHTTGIYSYDKLRSLDKSAPTA